MNIEPRVPKQTADNSRGSSSRKRFWVNTSLVVAFFTLLYVSLGWIAAGIVHFMPLSWEKRLAFSAPSSWTGNDSAPEGIRQLFERMQDRSESVRTFRLYVVPESDINAYAFPGGHIALTSALVERIDSEEALAFVIAHEIGHFEHRHMLKRMSRGVVFGLAKGILFGRDPTRGLLDRAESLADLGYSRGQEEQADDFALGCLNRAYGHVGGAMTFFRQIERAGWSLQLLETHPLPRSRVERIETMIRDGRFRGASPRSPAESAYLESADNPRRSSSGPISGERPRNAS